MTDVISTQNAAKPVFYDTSNYRHPVFYGTVMIPVVVLTQCYQTYNI